MKLLLIIWLTVPAGFAQEVGRNAAVRNDGSATFKTTAQLVVETIEVKDRSGKPVEGLDATEFTLTEDGVLQTIRFFEYRKLQATPDLLSAEARSQAPPAGPSGRVQYKDKRLLALYFDFTASGVSDRLRALAAAEKFIRSHMTADDLIALMIFSGGSAQMLADFTGDRDALENSIQALSLREMNGLEESGSDLNIGDTGAAFGQNDGEFNIFSTDRQLSALQTAAKLLGRISGKKSLIYFGGGLRLNGMDNQAQLHATINAAVRAGVSFWPIDSRGLTAEAPLGDASKGSPGGIGMYTGAAALAAGTNLQRSQDSLWTLAADTGGKALFDSNDLTAGIVQAQRATSSYYILGYYTGNDAADGKFRNIKITVKSNLAVNLSYRRGYYSGRKFSKLAAADRERQLEDALMAGDPITDLSIAMEVDYFRLNRAEYLVPLTVKIPGNELTLARRGGADRTRIDFIGEVKDEFGTTVQNVRDKVDVKLSAAAAAELSKHPIEYDTAFTLLPGKYSVKFLARDLETGRIGTYQTLFAVPDLNRNDQRVPVSSVVLSSQQAGAADVIYSASKKTDTANPLLRDGRKLVPSVTRVFSKSGELHIFAHAYPSTIGNHRPLIAFAALYRGQTKALETPALRLMHDASYKLSTVPVNIDIPLDRLPAGEYRCQLSIIDPASGTATFWQARILLVP